MKSKFKEGDRIIVTSRTWPERYGCEGVVVAAPNGPGIYPDDKPNAPGVIVLLDDDPLVSQPPRLSGWTCVFDEASLARVVAAGGVTEPAQNQEAK